MKTFFFTLNVSPALHNKQDVDVEGAIASCWVCADDARTAFSKGCFKIKQYDWDIVIVEDNPIEVTEDNFAGKDIGLDYFRKAQKNGMSMEFTAWAKDGKSACGPIAMKRSDSFCLNAYLSKIKYLAQKGRCLYYEGEKRCSHIINAHSIQKQGVLSLIAEDGHVYAVSNNHSDIVRNRRAATFTLQGVNKVSTFRGFCEKHDNKLFEPIDKYKFIPTNKQIFLYAYRSICREVFVKENNLSLFIDCYEKQKENCGLKNIFNDICTATEYGLKDLLLHKDKFDECLKESSYSKIKYVIFCTEQQPQIVFSGSFFPDYDFIGKQLQDIYNYDCHLAMITFSFVPMDKGWGILFAWHNDSSYICSQFIQSLVTRYHEDKNIGNCFFRMVISCCENIAMQPKWWKSIKEEQRREITEVSSRIAPINYDYLVCGLENIVDWRFEDVISDMR